jgi:hypothetical protein
LSGIFIQSNGQRASTDREDDIEKLIARADLTYNTPVTRSEAGMPIGNGTMGSLVWTTPTSMHLQINRVDVFAMNASSNNFYQRHTDYCNGIAFVDVDFSSGLEDVFTAPHFNQQLHCYNGEVVTNGKGVETKVAAWMQDDVMVIEVDDERTHPASISINLRTLRAPITRKGNHSAISLVSTADNNIVLKQEFAESNYYAGSSIVIGITGRVGRAIKAHDEEVKIIVPPGKGKFVIFIATDASFDRNVDLVVSANNKIDNGAHSGIGKWLV